uniref:Putative peptidase n=1 Tax=viral metagenome TaxID=1070528 RepID=A0A6H1ZG67_9ZZZZ
MPKRTHDHEIVIGSSTYRLNLLRDKDGVAMYNVVEDIPQYQNPLLFTQANWRGGHGQHTFTDPSMYFEGQSIDTTQEGKVFLGPKITEVYLNALQKQNYTSGDDGAGLFGGATWMGQTFTPASTHTLAAVKLYLTRTPGLWPGLIKVSIRATTAGLPTGDDLATGVTDGNLVSTTKEWITIPMHGGLSLTSGTVYAIVVRADAGASTTSISWRLDGTSPTYTGGQYVSSTNSGTSWTAVSSRDFLFEEWAVGASELDSAPVDLFYASTANVFLAACAQKIYYYNGVGMVAATTNVAGVTHMIEYNGIIYAALGASNKYYYSSDGDTWTLTDLTDGYANKFLVAPNPAGTADVLWKYKTPNELSYTTDGRTVAAGGAQWSSPAYIGDTSTGITNIMLANDNLLVGKKDGLFHYASDAGIHPLMPDLVKNKSSANFEHFTNFQSSLYFSLAKQMGEMSAYNTSQAMGPLVDVDDINKVGDIAGEASDRDWLYVAVQEGAVVHIYKGRQYRDTSGALRWSWCPWVYLGTNGGNVIRTVSHSETDRRLWFAYSTHVGYIVLSDNPLADDRAIFAPSGFLRGSYIYGTNPYWDKLFQTVVTETINCSATETVSTKYRKDTDTSATALTSAIVTNGVVLTSLSSVLSSKRIQFELHLVTGDFTTTPEVLFFQARGIEKPESIRIHEAVYDISNMLQRRAETFRSNLRTARTTTSLIKFADLRYGDDTAGTAGTDYVWVVMQPSYPQEVEVLQEKGSAPRLGLKVRWQEVTV